ncbi:hypothetical protein Tco_1269907, partial [Tanacetum coccineum]
MKLNEVNKLCDSTLKKIRDNLLEMVNKNERLKGREWNDKDIKRSNEMLDKINQTLKRREQLRRFEEYVGGCPKKFDPRFFVRPPIRYLQGELKRITHIDFKGMSFEQLTEIVRSVDGEDLENVDFYTTGEEDVIIKNLTTHDEFLNRLCSTGGLFRSGVPKPSSSLPNIPEDDP